VGVLTLGILETGSRGGLLAFVAGIGALLVCGGERTRRRRPLVVCMMAGLLGLFVVQEFRTGTSTATRLERAWTEGDTTGRTGIYDAAWAMFMDKPLFGHGGVNNRFTLGVHMNRDFLDTHNMFLSVLTEVGLVGALPLLLGLFYVLWGSWRSGAAVAFAPLCALLVMNISVTGSREKIFWVIVAAAAAGWTARPPVRAAVPVPRGPA
jgi:O-antigen ligase